MGFPEDVLALDEQVLLYTHPHWKMLAGPVAVFIVGTALAGFGAGAVFRYVPVGQGQSVAIWAIVGVWALVIAWRCIGRFLEWKTTHFVVTDRRVIIRHGVLTHTGRDIPMSRISSVRFRNGLTDRMLGTGTLIIDSSSQEPLEYDDIPQVEQVHSLLYHQAFDSGNSGYHVANEYRAPMD